MRKDEFLHRLSEEVLLGDGALGTMLGDLGVNRDMAYERLNASDPDLIRRIHQQYIDAGSQLIETNTFGANRLRLGTTEGSTEIADLVRAGVALAREAASSKAFVGVR